LIISPVRINAFKNKPEMKNNKTQTNRLVILKNITVRILDHENYILIMYKLSIFIG